MVGDWPNVTSVLLIKAQTTVLITLIFCITSECPTLSLLPQGRRRQFRPRRRPGELTPFLAPRIQGTLFGAFPKSEQAQAQRPKQPPPLPPFKTKYHKKALRNYQIWLRYMYFQRIVL